MRKTPAAIGTAVLGAFLLLAGCQGSSNGNAGAAASSAKGAVASVTADPRVHAELDQAKMLVKSCFAGTPLAQIHQVHLVFLSSSAGKHGPEVVAARDKTFTCLGIPQDKRTAFKNDAIIAAEHGKVYTKAGAASYLEFTLPQLVLKYKGLPASPAATASASAS